MSPAHGLIRPERAHRGVGSVVEVLDQRAAVRDGEQLHAPADPEGRNPAAPCLAEEGQLPLVDRAVGVLAVSAVASAIRRRMDVAPPGQEQAMGAFEGGCGIGAARDHQWMCTCFGDPLGIRWIEGVEPRSLA
jgi:hypothetical protein